MTEMPQKPTLIAGGLVEKNGKFLLVKAKVGSPKGLWNLPTGKVGRGETVEETAVREVKEETGFDTEITGLVGAYHRLAFGDYNDVIRVSFKMKIKGGELEFPEDEIEEARWFSLEELKKTDDSKFAFGTKETILDYYERGIVKQKIFSSKKHMV